MEIVLVVFVVIYPKGKNVSFLPRDCVSRRHGKLGKMECSDFSIPVLECMYVCMIHVNNYNN